MVEVTPRFKGWQTGDDLDFSQPVIRFPRYLTWLRSLACGMPGCRCTPIHAHHVRGAATSGTGLKPPDWYCVPLCYKHHAQIHQIGVMTFQRMHRVILLEEAARYATEGRRLGLLPLLDQEKTPAPR